MEPNQNKNPDDIFSHDLRDIDFLEDFNSIKMDTSKTINQTEEQHQSPQKDSGIVKIEEDEKDIEKEENNQEAGEIGIKEEDLRTCVTSTEAGIENINDDSTPTAENGNQLENTDGSCETVRETNAVSKEQETRPKIDRSKPQAAPKLSKKYQCMDCKMTFSNIGDLVEHDKDCTGFEDNEDSASNAQSESGGSPVDKPLATKATRGGRGRGRRRGGKKDNSCPTCSRYCRSPAELERHMVCHTGEKKFECQTCHRLFGRKATLKQHESTHSGEEFHCRYCTRKFTRKTLLKKHEENSHVGELNDPDKSNVEDDSFTEIKPRRNEKRLSSVKIKQEEPEIDSDSDRTLPEEDPGDADWSAPGSKVWIETEAMSNLESIARDAMERPISPDDLAKDWICTPDLKKEPIPGVDLPALTENAYPKMDTYGGVAFPGTESPKDGEPVGDFPEVNMSVSKETMSASGKRRKDNSCKVCGRFCRSPAELQRHMVSHTGEKNFECPTCHRLFGTKGTLRQHAVVHTGKKNYPCRLCGKRFTRTSVRRIHEEKVHKEENMDDAMLTEGRSTHSSGKYSDETVSQRNDGDDEGTQLGSKLFADSKLNDPKEEPQSDESDDSIDDLLAAAVKASVNPDDSKTDQESSSVSSKAGSRPRTQKHQNKGKRGRKKHLCSHCDFVCYTKTELQKHLKTHDGQKDIKCPICEKVFSSLAGLELHMKSVHFDSKEHICAHCGSEFATASYLKAHETKEHPDLEYKPPAEEKRKKHYCLYCGLACRTPSELSRHEVTHTGVREYVCAQCGISFGTKLTLKQHEVVHSDQRNYRCSYENCTKSFKRKSACQIHERLHDPNAPKLKTQAKLRHFCSECGHGCRAPAELRRHMVRHTGKREWGCSICGKYFVTKNVLKQHQLVHSDARDWVCSQCGKAFKRKAMLTLHEQIHDPNRPPPVKQPAKLRHFCEICGRGCRAPAELKCHMTTHTGQKDFECQQCFKRFSTKSGLRQHAFVHTSRKQFLCLVCGKAFSRPGILRMHERLHTCTEEERKEFMCGQCGQWFTLKSTLKQHEMVHTGKKDFQCQYCFEQFSRKAHVLRHIERRHNVNKPPRVPKPKNFNCEICMMPFSRRAHVVRHIEKKHVAIFNQNNIQNTIQNNLNSIQNTMN